MALGLGGVADPWYIYEIMRHPRPAKGFSDFNLSEKLASNGILAAKISGIANGQFEDKLNNQVIDVDTGEVVSGSVLNSRVERYKLKSAVNDFISKSRTAKCMRWIRGNNQAQVFTYINPQSQKTHAFYGNLMVCGNVWLCPLCAAKISERRREK